MKQKVIEKIMSTHGLPLGIAEQIVDDTGGVDTAKLELALAGVSWGQNPVSSADPGLIQALIDALKQARTRKDFPAVINLKTRLFKMGVPDPG